MELELALSQAGTERSRGELGVLIYEQFTSAAGGVSGASSRTDPGHKRLVIAASLSHDDVTDRHIFWYIQDTRTGAPFVALQHTRDGGGAAIPAARHYGLHRQIVLPEFWRLVGETDGLVVTGTVTLRLAYYDIFR